MRTLTKCMLLGLAATVVVGCDPFEEAIGGAPTTIGAGFSEGACGELTAYEATGSALTWTITGATAICANTTAGVAEAPGFLWAKFNKLLDGGSIQVNPTNCTAAAALSLSVTPAAPATQTWYACYNPQSPVPNEGAAVMIFLGPTAAPPSGWNDPLPITASGTTVTTVHATCTAHDKDGAAAPFDVTLTIDPDPGVTTAPTFADITATTLTVNWVSCVAVTSFDVQRAPDNAGAPGTFATIGNTAGVTFGDTGRTAVTTYWYRVVANLTAGGTQTSAAASVTTTPVAPAAPTFASVTSTSLTVNWTAAPVSPSATPASRPGRRTGTAS